MKNSLHDKEVWYKVKARVYTRCPLAHIVTGARATRGGGRTVATKESRGGWRWQRRCSWRRCIHGYWPLSAARGYQAVNIIPLIHIAIVICRKRCPALSSNCRVVEYSISLLITICTSLFDNYILKHHSYN